MYTERHIVAMDDNDSTTTITVTGQVLDLINRSNVDITFTVNSMTATLPAGDSFSGRFGIFESFIVTCPSSEDWSYVVYG